jgi:hypothetical protein
MGGAEDRHHPGREPAGGGAAGAVLQDAGDYGRARGRQDHAGRGHPEEVLQATRPPALLLAAPTGRAALLPVGDVNQLPSVGPRQVLAMQLTEVFHRAIVACCLPLPIVSGDGADPVTAR